MIYLELRELAESVRSGDHETWAGVLMNMAYRVELVEKQSRRHSAQLRRVLDKCEVLYLALEQIKQMAHDAEMDDNMVFDYIERAANKAFAKMNEIDDGYTGPQDLTERLDSTLRQARTAMRTVGDVYEYDGTDEIIVLGADREKIDEAIQAINDLIGED